MYKTDDLMARTIVETLSMGIHPLTGERLSPPDCCADEVVQEALKTVLKNCSLDSCRTVLQRQRQEREFRERERPTPKRKKGRYPNRGKVWTKAEEQQLNTLYTEYEYDIETIARMMKRSPQGISARLKKMKIVDAD